jgi:4-amino-4-deoxy-L-arabinose transferase-like glycosyltransferase
LIGRRRFLGLLVAIATLAFLGRVVYVVTVTRHEPLNYDEHYFANGAIALADGDGFRYSPLLGARVIENAEHPPLTSIALAPIARMTDDSELAMRIAVALAGAGVVVLIGLVGREVAGARTGVVAAALAAVYPNLWSNDGLLMSETFATLGTAATVLCAYRLIRAPTSTMAAAAGVACGLAMLSRGELALLVPLLVLPVVLTLRRVTRGQRLRLAGIAVLAASLTVAPWVAYNLSRFERPVFLSYGDGALLGANCDEVYSGPLLGLWNGLCTFGKPSDEPSVLAERKRERALEYARDHLDRLPVVAAARVGRTWSVFRPFQMAEISEAEGKPKWVSLTGWGAYWVLLPLAAWGTILLRRRGVALIPLVAPAVIVTVAVAAFYGRVRFRAPAEVSIVVLAAVTLDALLVARTSRKRGARAA